MNEYKVYICDYCAHVERVDFWECPECHTDAYDVFVFTVKDYGDTVALETFTTDVFSFADAQRLAYILSEHLALTIRYSSNNVRHNAVTWQFTADKAQSAARQ